MTQKTHAGDKSPKKDIEFIAENKSPFVQKELDFIKRAFEKTTYIGKDVLLIYSLSCVIGNSFKTFSKVDIHLLKQVLDKTTILCADMAFVAGIIGKMEKLITTPKVK